MADLWVQGFVTAVALIMRTHHEETVTKDVVRGVIGHGPEGLRAALLRAGAEEIDLLAIDPAFVGSNKHMMREWFGDAAREGGG